MLPKPELAVTKFSPYSLYAWNMHGNIQDATTNRKPGVSDITLRDETPSSTRRNVQGEGEGGMDGVGKQSHKKTLGKIKGELSSTISTSLGVMVVGVWVHLVSHLRHIHVLRIPVIWITIVGVWLGLIRHDVRVQPRVLNPIARPRIDVRRRQSMPIPRALVCDAGIIIRGLLRLLNLRWFQETTVVILHGHSSP